MARIDNIAHSGFLPSGESELIAFSREGAGWEWMSHLNFLAGTSRALTVTEDPDHLWIGCAWKQPDPRLPLVRS